MPELPKRPGPYLVGLQLVVLGILAIWMFSAVSSPKVRRAAAERGREPAAAARPPEPSNPRPPPAAAVSTAMDPQLRELGMSLNSPEHEPQQDLEILNELLGLHQRALGAHPSGDNSDIAAALVGAGAEGVFLPRTAAALREGQLIDRWGTPYWFHPVSANLTEIRSAGPDRQLFTGDDLLINPSPAGLGATPGPPPP
jgi:hypothetical protein